MGILQKVSKVLTTGKVGKVLDTAVTTVAHPLKVVGAVVSPSKTVSQVTKEFMDKPLKTQVTETVIAGAGYVTLGTGAALSLAKGAVAVATSSTKAKVITAIAAPIAVGAVINQPALLGKVASAPAELGNFGGDVSNFIAEPSVQSAKNIFKESPLISTAIIGAGVVAGGAVATSAISGYLTREEMEKQTKALEAQTAAIVGGSIGETSTTQLIKEKALGNGEVAPVRQTTTVSTGKRRYKPRTAKKEPQIRNNIRLNILNNPVGMKVSSTKKYLNNGIYN